MPAARSPGGAAAVLEARGLVKRYGDRVALGGVSLSAHAAELTAIVGPNGAGKTTLLSILGGLQPADEGTLNRIPREVGWVPQQPALYGKLTVRENLELFARLEHVEDVAGATERMLAQTALGDRADDQVGRLSGGNKQRLNVALGLLSEPEVLLLDEPTAALDPRQRERLWEFVTRLAGAGTSVVYATHNVREVERYADQVVVLADGELVFAGSPASLAHEAGGGNGDFESAFVDFLHRRGH